VCGERAGKRLQKGVVAELHTYYQTAAHRQYLDTLRPTPHTSLVTPRAAAASGWCPDNPPNAQNAQHPPAELCNLPKERPPALATDIRVRRPQTGGCCCFSNKSTTGCVCRRDPQYVDCVNMYVCHGTQHRAQPLRQQGYWPAHITREQQNNRVLPAPCRQVLSCPAAAAGECEGQARTYGERGRRMGAPQPLAEGPVPSLSQHSTA
jgi:hypothetical protein